MTDKFVYRASKEFAAAFALREKEREDFATTVLVPFLEEFPQQQPMASSSTLTLDKTFVGFADDAPVIPSGLRRRGKLGALVPRTTESGTPWQERLDRLNAMPRIGEVFERFSIPEAVFNLGQSMVSRVGLKWIGGELWMMCGSDLLVETNSPHIVSQRLSAYYLAAEAEADRREAEDNAFTAGERDGNNA